MDRLAKNKLLKERRRNRVRAKISGTSDRPRLSIKISNYHISAQLIDDVNNHTLIYVTTIGTKLNGTMTEKAAKIGSEVAKKAKNAKIKHVVFDKGDKLYHGRIKALADAAREEGLEF